MTTYTIHTNAGPILTRDLPSAAAARRYMEERIPLLRRPSYSAKWERNGPWHVVRVRNSRGRLVHSAAFRPGDLR